MSIHTRTSLVSTGVLMAIGSSLWFARATEPVLTEGSNDFMERKLAVTQRIVEGLARDDFALIQQAADELLEIRESAHWAVSDDPFYAFYTRDFERSVEELREAAKAESTEKATFAYTHMTFSCTACHQRIRRVKRVADPNASRRLPPRR